MATTTAHGKFSFQTMVNGKTLFEHARAMNDRLEDLNVSWKNGKRFNRMSPGQWGTEINVCRIGEAIEKCSASSSLEDIAEKIHEGWKECFLFWKANEPWKWISPESISLYTRPCKQSRDKEERATKSFEDLDVFQKKVIFQMAEYVRDECL